MARRIVVTSGKGGVGKTTCSLLLGLNLANMGVKVVILDVDVGLNNLDVVAGIDMRINYDLIEVVEHRCRLKQALIKSDHNPQLYFLPCTNMYQCNAVTKEGIKEVLDELDKDFNYIIIDCPAGIGDEFLRAVFYANEALIVTTPHLIAIRDAGKVANLLCGYQLSNVGLVVNRVRQDFVAKRLMLSPHQIAQSLKLPLIGVIRESQEITLLSSECGDLCAVNDVASDFLELAKNVHSLGVISNKPSFLDIKIRRG